jgi:Outer membrane lipoprotein-sorting protein
MNQAPRLRPSISKFAVWSLLLLCLWAANGCNRDASAPAQDNTASAAQRGAEIVAEFLKRDGAPYRKNRVRMTIVSPPEPAKTYEIELWRKQTAAETLTLTHVVQPPAESDLAALSIEKPGVPTVNVTYVSSTGDFRETGTNKMFFGGLTAQELLGEWDKYDYRLLGEKDLQGVKVYEVEGTLKPGNDSAIAKSKVLFRADTYLPAVLELFNSGGDKVRTFRVEKYKTVGSHEVVSHMEIENHVRQAKISIETLNVEFPEKVDDAMFAREHLKQLAK